MNVLERAYHLGQRNTPESHGELMKLVADLKEELGVELSAQLYKMEKESEGEPIDWCDPLTVDLVLDPLMQVLHDL